MPKLSKLELSLPFGLGKVEWEPDVVEKKAAWSLYIELVTRIAVEPIPESQGHLREALSSLYSLFATTRQILREAGPQVGISEGSLGWLAIEVLNHGLRPFLSYWQPLLEDWETKRLADISRQEHERKWSESSKLREALENLRKELKQYADALALIAEVQNENQSNE
jgi:hypothetical protein